MFDDPRITRQLADARLEDARRYVADRRLAGRTRHRHHDRSRLRMSWIAAFHRADRSAPAPHPTTA